MGITPVQEKVLRFVEAYLEKHRCSPSYEEIKAHFGFRSKNAVFKHLKQLEQRGYLESTPRGRRSLKLIPLRISTVSIQLLGVVAAGSPIEAVETPELIDVPESFLGNGSNFALRVKGDSMIEEGIREGDTLIITRQPQAESGQTVVAMIHGESTVKKFYRLGEDEIELRPANREMAPIRVPAGEVEIVGVVVGLLRNYKSRH